MKKEHYGVSELNPIVVKGNSASALFGMMLGDLGGSKSDTIDEGIRNYFEDLRCPSGAKAGYTMRPKRTADVRHRAFSAAAVMSASQRTFDLACECGGHKAVVFVTQREEPSEAPAPIGIEGWHLVGTHGEMFDKEEKSRREAEERLAREQAEKKRVEDVKRARREARQCVFCGRRLGLLARIRRRESCRQCTAFVG